MSTNKIALKTVDQFMSDYTPVYQPIFPLLLSGKTKKYSVEVGQLTLKRLKTVGDIRNHHMNPKDTNIHQISSALSSKVYKKYFLTSQYQESNLQDHEGLQGVVAEVLDEHNKHADDLLFLGEGTSASTMINNGLFWSDDPNYVLENSAAVSAGSDTHVSDMYAKMLVTVAKSNEVAGRKVMLVYGATAKAKLTTLFASAPTPLLEALQKAMVGWQIIQVPGDVNLSGDGWIALNMDQIMVHYSAIPELNDNGVNSEKMYSWHNFLMGSMMVEVLAPKGIVRQPVTFA